MHHYRQGTLADGRTRPAPEPVAPIDERLLASLATLRAHISAMQSRLRQAELILYRPDHPYPATLEEVMRDFFDELHAALAVMDKDSA